MKDDKSYEVIIIGGSYAGLSAAMALGRSLRSVLVIDSDLPCNRQTPHSHNFITHDGEKPQNIVKKAREEVLNYTGVKLHKGVAVSGKKTSVGFEIATESGEIFNAKKLIFATGVEDIIPSIQGFSACWGISVIHCPYCHGYEFKNKKTAIMANGERAFHLAGLVNNLSTDLTLLTSGKADLDFKQKAKLQVYGIEIIEEEIGEIQHKNGWVQQVILKNGTVLAFDAVYAAIPFRQHSVIPVELGCELTEQGHLKIDNFQKTTIAGVFACGDNSSMMRSVSNAVAAGNLAGAMVNKELIDENF